VTVGYTVAARNTQLDALTTLIGNLGLLRIYDGTRPATGGAATTLLAVFTLASPFAPAAAAGAFSPTLPANTVGLAAGTATWFRIATAAGTAVVDGSVGTSGTDLILNTTTISIGLTCAITAFTGTGGNP
jgi:hypothetical protein